MPELPEVEITRRHLSEVVDGAVFSEVKVTHERTARHNSGPAEIEERLTGRRVTTLERTGKFIHAPLDDGQTFVSHLGMSGRFTIDGDDELHTHFLSKLDTGHVVRFVDPRTFGFIAIYDDTTIGQSGLRRLGRDALADLPDGKELLVALANRSAPIKALLLEQRIVSGLGNIYADEALHLAGIHPLGAGGSLRPSQLDALLEAIRLVLMSSLENGGTSLDDLSYLLPDGRAGENLDRLLAYGRAGEPCSRCGTPIEVLTIRGRSSHFCPSCQAGE